MNYPKEWSTRAPTPEEVIEWLKHASPENQIKFVGAMLRDAKIGHRCEYEQHTYQIDLGQSLGKWLLAEADWERAYWATENTGNDPQRLWERIQHNRKNAGRNRVCSVPGCDHDPDSNCVIPGVWGQQGTIK